MMIIKNATLDDIDTLCPLVACYHLFENITLNEHDRRNALIQILSKPSLGQVWLITDSEKIIGYIVLTFGYSIEFAGLDAFIDEFFIVPEYRGQGIGSQVLSEITVEAQKFNINAIHLEVAINNLAAQKLYQRANFVKRNKYVLMSCDLK